MKSKRPLRSLIIVGGGTSASMAAAYLRNLLPEEVQISLVYPQDNQVTGVGEATVPSIRFFMRSLGLKESTWLAEANGTLKAAIKFTNWTAAGGYYYHPFHRKADLAAKSPSRYDFDQPFRPGMLESLQNADHFEFLDGISNYRTILDNNLSPVSKQGQSLLSYAYHFDSRLFGQILREKAISMGVKEVRASVSEVKLLADGSIGWLLTDEGQEIHGDFYIDASGFQKCLSGQLQGYNFVDFKDRLFTDSALSLNFELESNNLPNYTEAIATDSGWIWKIPLRNRYGSGIVFNSQFDDYESAEKKLRSHFNSNGVDGAKVLKIPMKVGRLEKSWNKNCIAIGLASSFIEPLESTSIGLTEFQLYMIERLLPKSLGTGDFSNIYNSKVNLAYDKTADFIALHYLLSDRQDSPFWSWVQTKKQGHQAMEIVERINEWVATPEEAQTYEMYGRFSHACLFTGLGRQFQFNLMGNPSGRQNTLADQKQKILEENFTHLRYLGLNDLD